MKQSTKIANDIYERYGALLTTEDIKNYAQKSRSWVRRNLIPSMPPVENGKGAKKWFYEDVAKAICGEL